MILEAKFETSDQSIKADFGEIHIISDGGYERGYDEGYTEGHDLGYKEGHETGYKAGGNGILSIATGMRCLFDKAVLPEGTDVEVYCPNFLDQAAGIASASKGLRKLTLKCNDTSGAVDLSGSFNGSSVEILDISQFKHTPSGVVNCFIGSKIVTVIGAFDCSLLTGTLNFFANASRLVNVTFVPNTIGCSLAIKTATLSTDSAKSAILGLKNYSGMDEAYTCTLSLHANVWALLDTEGATAPGGVTWREYVTDIVCWNA